MQTLKSYSCVLVVSIIAVIIWFAFDNVGIENIPEMMDSHAANKFIAEQEK